MKMKGAFMVFFRIGLVTLTTMVKTAHCHDPENAQIVIQAKKIERDAVNGIMYGNFRKHEFRRLSPRGRKETVAGITKPIDCTKSCLIAFWCWSYNLKRKANPDGTFLCELLSTHMYEKESKQEFRPDRDFDHHSIETACDETPCQNGGTCAPLYIEDDYNCTCTQGFTGKRCDQDKDECSLGSHDCHSKATCKNTYGSHNCTCKDGFEGDGKTCTDVNECAASEKHNCHGKGSWCHNTVGSFKCVCESGFKVDKNADCVDEDECTRGDKCHARATCTNTHGSFNCTCNDGFEGDGVTKCEDVNECTSNKHNCSGDTVCDNTDGSFACVCKLGFKNDGKGGCEDQDECALGMGNCDSNAHCTNTDGSYKCTCNEGFAGDGTSCDDFDECTNAKHDCSGDTVCDNTVGSFVCVCKSGLKSDGIGGCEDINECMGGNNCHSNANCINTRGSYNCICKDGYEGDGVTKCAEIDRCALCDNNAACDNNKCRCNSNYIGDGRHCFGENGDCKHLKNNRGFKYNGWYRIRAREGKSYMAYCQMETEGGQHPWTVFQRRVNGDISFEKVRKDYADGFGDGSNIWLGLRALVEFSKKGSLNLLVEMEDWEGNKANASYKEFKVKRPNAGNGKPFVDPSLTFSSGTAGDSLSYHEDQGFSFIDADNDGENNKHCAQEFQAGWWFKKCPPASTPPYWSNLNGQYLGNSENIKGIIWTSFKGKLSLKSTEMKFQFSD